MVIFAQITMTQFTLCLQLADVALDLHLLELSINDGRWTSSCILRRPCSALPFKNVLASSPALLP